MPVKPSLRSWLPKLRKCGRDDIAPDIIKRAATRDGKALDEVRKAVDMIASGQVVQKNLTPTIEQIGKRWTSGELAVLYPDRVKRRRSAETNRYVLDKYVYPMVGDVAIDKFTLDHAEAVMRSLPAKLAPNSRRSVAQLVYRIGSLAVLPLRHIAVHPLPRGFVPRYQAGKAKGWLYPDEDAMLLGCTQVPLEWRLFYGFLHREGMRRSEALNTRWSDINLDLGAIVLDVNKTDEPRAWVLSPGVVAALRAWRDHCAARGVRVSGDAHVFVYDEGSQKGQRLTTSDTAGRFRGHLELAGIRRPELFTADGGKDADPAARYARHVRHARTRERKDGGVGAGPNGAQVKRHDQPLPTCRTHGGRARAQGVPSAP